MSRRIPGAGAVRSEDAFDVEAVAAWLRAVTPDSADVLAGVDLGDDDEPVIPEVSQFSGGASNLTYVLRYPGVDLVLRRPPAGTKARGAHDMKREYRVQSALRPVYPLVPRMVGFCDDHSVIGSDFYVMERLEGTILRKDLPRELRADKATIRRLSERAVDALVDLHAVDVRAAGLDDLDRGEGYVRRQVEGWSARYRRARTPDVPDFAPVMKWLDANQPEDVGHCLVHNDFRFDNLVLDPGDITSVIGVLDWEMATVGDPLMDLGGALAYWVEDGDGPVFKAFRRQPTHAPGMLTRWEVVERYAERSGLEISEKDWRFYEVFGLFRLAVIAQQINHRFFRGQTTNPAFRAFRPAVGFLEQRCLRIIRTGDGRLTPTRLGPRDVIPELLAVPRVILPLLAGGVHDARQRIGGILGGLPGAGNRT
ncbi:phosphotransferase family protein [Dietzia sp. SLG310A2-38A2]|uniref:phosphotransferase family protein n=1 Tax=Dietzia sp. SLG310A2-38A2 TaxID=1630643 RepID=UPI0015F8C8A3|nr:phosphotransferase family protein [Dietzia sp. SLG310A2-38A2]MBB1032409.1 phosphotransferase family protein [Dietzia sp. SLG310A2-38A2]